MIPGQKFNTKRLEFMGMGRTPDEAWNLAKQSESADYNAMMADQPHRRAAMANDAALNRQAAGVRETARSYPTQCPQTETLAGKDFDAWVRDNAPNLTAADASKAFQQAVKRVQKEHPTFSYKEVWNWAKREYRALFDRMSAPNNKTLANEMTPALVAEGAPHWSRILSSEVTKGWSDADRLNPRADKAAAIISALLAHFAKNGSYADAIKHVQANYGDLFDGQAAGEPLVLGR